MAKKELFLWVGNFNYAHELVTKYTYAPSWASAKARMLRRIAKEHDVGYDHVFHMFDGSKANYTIEREEK